MVYWFRVYLGCLFMVLARWTLPKDVHAKIVAKIAEGWVADQIEDEQDRRWRCLGGARK